MERLIVDSSTWSKIGELREPHEICDSSGRVLGRFFPVADRALYDEVNAEIDEAELDRRSAETEVYSTAEVLRHLER